MIQVTRSPYHETNLREKHRLDPEWAEVCYLCGHGIRSLTIYAVLVHHGGDTVVSTQEREELNRTAAHLDRGEHIVCRACLRCCSGLRPYAVRKYNQEHPRYRGPL